MKICAYQTNNNTNRGRIDFFKSKGLTIVQPQNKFDFSDYGLILIHSSEPYLEQFTNERNRKTWKMYYSGRRNNKPHIEKECFSLFSMEYSDVETYFKHCGIDALSEKSFDEFVNEILNVDFELENHLTLFSKIDPFEKFDGYNIELDKINNYIKEKYGVNL